jgi:hypothetical protein
VRRRDDDAVGPLAASTSSAVRVRRRGQGVGVHAPRNSGPVMPWPARYSTTACVMAAMCVSVKALASEEPR